VHIELHFNKKELIPTDECLPNEFYENESETSSTLIAFSIIKELFENNLITDREFNYILNKYGLLSLT
jgi:transcriptional regulator CtsR